MRRTLHYLTSLRKSRIIGDYAIGGAMAATFYIDPVTTFDLDIFVTLPQKPDGFLVSLASLYAHLRTEGFKEDKECVIIFGVPVQFLPVYNPLLEEALTCAVEMDYDGVKVPVFSAEHLTAFAVQTGSGKDMARAQSFYESGILDQVKISDILARYGLEAKWKQWTANHI